MARKKTLSTKAAEGTLRKDRTKQQKTGLLLIVPAPTFKLEAQAETIFKRVAAALIAEEVFTALDVDTLTQYAFWFNKFIEIKNADYPAINEFANGTNQQSGATNLLLKFDDKVQKYSNLLGLSIKARDLMASFEKAETETESPIESAMLRINKAI